MGGRLLPGDAGARAHFIFEDKGGQRVLLYLGTVANAATSSDAERAGESAFGFSAEGPVPSFYWVDRRLGYAFAGTLPRDALLRLATLVYRQL